LGIFFYKLLENENETHFLLAKRRFDNSKFQRVNNKKSWIIVLSLSWKILTLDFLVISWESSIKCMNPTTTIIFANHTFGPELCISCNFNPLLKNHIQVSKVFFLLQLSFLIIQNQPFKTVKINGVFC